tara:strand:- start:27742 stop:29880 length:2139 start_codon:yes stop_codon:yes gene_type:complete
MRKLWRIIIILLFLVLLGAYFQFGWYRYTSLEALSQHYDWLLAYYQQNPLTTISIYFFLYIILVAASIPGATVITLAAGAIFGLWMGTIIVSFASTIGATLAFLAARFVFRDWVEAKFPKILRKINRGLEKEGAIYLLSLRLLPIFPFFLINLVMGLTQMHTWKYYLLSQLGMLAGTMVYVNAGTQLGQIQNLQDVFSLDLFVSFLLIGLLPIFAKSLISYLKKRKYYRAFKKPKNFDYNMIVIGAGSAGLVSSYIASAVKSKVMLVEKDKMGGDCLNTGCVPSKALIHSAKLAHTQKSLEAYGLPSKHDKLDFRAVMQKVKQAIQKIEPHDSVERYQSLGVECVQGEAKILSPYEVQIKEKVYTCRSIVVATGASPFLPSIPGINEVGILTSENLWDLEELPKRLVVMGGGAIGCEMAQAFARLGAKVTILEKGSGILPKEDEDISSVLMSRLRQEEGLEILCGAEVMKLAASEGEKQVHYRYQNTEQIINCDAVICALGRKANVEGFGLENLEVEKTANGALVVDENMALPAYPNIYACGDVIGQYQFTHTASHQAWHAAVNALFPLKFKIDNRVIPWAIYTSPELARVGLSEMEARQQGVEYDVSCYDIADLDRAITDGNDYGLIKVLTKKGKDKILGVHIVSERAADIIAEFVLAMKYNIGLNKILSTIHIYPTYAEANKFVAGVWKRKNTSQSLLSILQAFHSWRRS